MVSGKEPFQGFGFEPGKGLTQEPTQQPVELVKLDKTVAELHVMERYMKKSMRTIYTLGIGGLLIVGSGFASDRYINHLSGGEVSRYHGLKVDKRQLEVGLKEGTDIKSKSTELEEVNAELTRLENSPYVRNSNTLRDVSLLRVLGFGILTVGRTFYYDRHQKRELKSITQSSNISNGW